MGGQWLALVEHDGIERVNFGFPMLLVEAVTIPAVARLLPAFCKNFVDTAGYALAFSLPRDFVQQLINVFYGHR